jgi:AcrR family transcriptional regulator
MTQQDTETSARIRSALLALLREKPWDKVRMSELARLSGTSRQNLYRYYHSRGEILRAVFDEMFEEFYETAEPYLKNFDSDIAYTVNLLAYTVTWNHREDFITLAGCGADPLLVQLLKQYFQRLIGALLRYRGIRPTNPEQLEVITDLLAGGTFQALKRWALRGMQQRPEEMARIHAGFFNADILRLIERG